MTRVFLLHEGTSQDEMDDYAPEDYSIYLSEENIYAAFYGLADQAVVFARETYEHDPETLRELEYTVADYERAVAEGDEDARYELAQALMRFDGIVARITSDEVKG